MNEFNFHATVLATERKSHPSSSSKSKHNNSQIIFLSRPPRLSCRVAIVGKTIIDYSFIRRASLLGSFLYRVCDTVGNKWCYGEISQIWQYI